MSGKKYLLDTNIIIDLFTGNQDIGQQIKQLEAPIVSAITIGELYFGAEKSQQRSKHLKQVNEFVEICTILDIDLATTKVYGKIKNALKMKGRPIHENDLWIAATSIQHNLVLATKDKHFIEIENLDLKQM
ncbi:MAG: type II toxin-antitoxin system VapC family toxin [Salinivirgaceae bacterium]|jgi:tRNA(fMet)-specific endonuclease VapC